jgi:quercetin dioxygenase-like cupin family protein
MVQIQSENAALWIERLTDVQETVILPGFKGRFIHGAGATVVYWEVAQGAELPSHSHGHEQISNILAGFFELTVNGETKVLEPGSVAVIPPNAEHSGRALSPCYILDVFTPVREDYKGY